MRATLVGLMLVVSSCSDSGSIPVTDSGVESHTDARADAESLADAVADAIVEASTVADAADENQTTDAPVFSVPGGFYAMTQTVALSSATPGAATYYTLDGNTPSKFSQAYTTPIIVTRTTTVRAIAIAPGYEPSIVNSATYTIEGNEPVAATPTISPSGGTYTTSQKVTLTTTEAKGILLFTTNGLLPTKTTGTVYAGPFTVSTSTMVIAITAVANKGDSLPAIEQYKIEVPIGTTAPPSFTPSPGEYTSAQTIGIATATTDATVCYTIDGTGPTCDTTKPIDQICSGTSTRFVSTTAPVLDTNKTLKAIACKAGSVDSVVTSGDYTFRAASPSITTSGSVLFDTVVFANPITTNAVLLYTFKTDTTLPADPNVALAGSCAAAAGTTAVPAGSFPWNIAKAIDATGAATGLRRNARFKFRSCRPGYNMSAVIAADFDVRLTAKLATSTPYFGVINSPLTPSFDNSEISASTLGANPLAGTFCYTTDGITTPTCGGTKTTCTAGTATSAAGPALSNNSSPRNLRIIACKPDTIDSAVLTGSYSFQLRGGSNPTSGSIVSIGAGNNIQLLVLQTAPASATDTTIAGSVYYTTNGTSPTVPTLCGATATSPTVLAAITAGVTANIDVNTITPAHSSAGSIFKFVACSPNLDNSAETTVTFSAPGGLAAPVISPPSGTYDAAFDTVRAPDAPSGAAPVAPKLSKVYFSRPDIANIFICWSDNGTDPECAGNGSCTSGQQISLNAETGVSESANFGGSPRVMKARACRPGYPQSPVATTSYTFKVATPILPAAPGLPFSTGYQATITGNNPGVAGASAIQVSATPTYATFAIENGVGAAADPVCWVSPTTASITSVPRVVKVRACATGFADSDIATTTYTTTIASQPTFTLSQRTNFAAPDKNALGKYHDYFDVTIASVTSETGAAAAGVGICYTTDGTTTPVCGSFAGGNLTCTAGTVIDTAGGNPSALITPTPSSGVLTVRALTCSSGLNTNASIERSSSYGVMVSTLNTTFGDVSVEGNKQRAIKLFADTTVVPNATRTRDQSLVACFSQTAMPGAGCTAPIAGSTYYCLNAVSAGGTNTDPNYRAYATRDGTMFIRMCKPGLEDATTTYNAIGLAPYSRTVTLATATGAAGEFVVSENQWSAVSATDGVLGRVSFDASNLYLGIASVPAGGQVDNLWNHSAEYGYFYISGSAPNITAVGGAGFPSITLPSGAGALASTATHGFGSIKYVVWTNGDNSSRGLVGWDGANWIAIGGTTFISLSGNKFLATVPRNAIGNPGTVSVMGGVEGGDFEALGGPRSFPAVASVYTKRVVIDLTAASFPTWTGHVCDSSPIGLPGATSDITANDGFFAFCP